MTMFQAIVNLINQSGREAVSWVDSNSVECHLHLSPSYCPFLPLPPPPPPSSQVLGDVFEKHVLTLDSPNITYITFDFHRHL